ALFMAGHGLVNPNTNALCLAPFSRHTGSAASLTGSFRMGMGGVVSALVTLFHDGTPAPMVGGMAGCSFTGLVILLAGSRWLNGRLPDSLNEEGTSMAI